LLDNRLEIFKIALYLLNINVSQLLLK